MDRYDVVVIGAGDVGLGIAFNAASAGLKVALIDKGYVGGTCVNYGCVPSKTLIYTADRILETLENAKLGIHSTITDIDFNAIMQRMRTGVLSGRTSIRNAIEDSGKIALIEGEAHFIDDHTVQAGERKIRGKKIFIASGARAAIPMIQGLDSVHYLTNETLLQLEKQPESMIFIGGGFVAVEYAHFFAALGTRVTIVDRNRTLLHFEEPEISELLRKEMGKRIVLHLGVETIEIKRTDNGKELLVRDIESGQETRIRGEAVMVSAGRRSNADLLKPENAGLETDGKNFIKVDEYLQTNRKHIWAVGDATGRAMFTHAGDKEAEIAWHNATNRKKIRMNFGLVPHAVYTNPQIASVGMTEQQARKEHEILVGRAQYSDTVMGAAMIEQAGFAKAIVEKNTMKILGFHIIGPHAAILIQEVINAMTNGGDMKTITGSMHIFPALSNVVSEAFGNLE
ncbi:MAG: dihydrolipoyl dehydrogenase [Nitrospirae bacterium]|nr:dihydrolipoyl dehydrogenase [Nitrospirota bacterium]